MFNTPLGKQLYENMLSLGQNIMTGKAAMYNDPIKMMNDFIDRKDGIVYFTKTLSLDDIKKIMQYVHEYTQYRIDFKLNGDSAINDQLKDLFDECEFKYDQFESSKTKNIKINERINKFAIWSDSHFTKFLMVINTGDKSKSVLNMTVELV